MMNGTKGVRKLFLIAVFGLVWIVSGCATNRGIVDVQIAVPQNPAAGKAVAITRVTDNRQFEVAPKEASIPSLKNPKEIENKDIRLRAIGRKRNSYGKALGDILLPENRTVEDLVQEALVRSFRESGYYVVDDPEAYEGRATMIEADIEQFWAWFTPGFWAVSLQFESIVNIKGDIPAFQDGETVKGHVELHSQAAGTRAWTNTINKGIDAFVAEVSKLLAE